MMPKLLLASLIRVWLDDQSLGNKIMWIPPGLTHTPQFIDVTPFPICQLCEQDIKDLQKGISRKCKESRSLTGQMEHLTPLI